jgi:hypothetical protein
MPSRLKVQGSLLSYLLKAGMKKSGPGGLKRGTGPGGGGVTRKFVDLKTNKVSYNSPNPQ